MSWNYCCPECEAGLDPGQAVILTASDERARILIGFHPKPGKFEVYLPPGIDAGDGKKWDFFCPACGKNLKTEKDDNLCELILRVDGDSVRILFSRIAGEHATFIVHQDALKEKHGEDAHRYDGLWAQMKYTRY